MVHFSTIEIHRYPYVAGDNPSVLDGVLLSLDWEFLGSSVMKLVEETDEGCPVNDPTKNHATRKKSISNGKHEKHHDDQEDDYDSDRVKRLSSQERRQRLEAAGVSESDIQRAIRQADGGRIQRYITRESVELTPGQEVFNEYFERAFRAVRNATYRKGHKERERQLLSRWRHFDTLDVCKESQGDRPSNTTVATEALNHFVH